MTSTKSTSRSTEASLVRGFCPSSGLHVIISREKKKNFLLSKTGFCVDERERVWGMFVVYIDYRQLRGAAVDLAGKRVVTPVSRFCLGYDVEVEL